MEPFYGGSHKDFADGLQAHSRHTITLKTLPARFWKWRMRGAALHFAATIPDPGSYDLLLTCGLLSLSDLKALWGPEMPPAVLYFHENQLSYPLPEGEKMDYQFGFTDITSALAADGLLFNSRFHRNDFLKNLRPFIARMPEYKPYWAIERIEEKAQILYPGCRFPGPAPEGGAPPLSATPMSGSPARKPPGGRPLIIWNHRWEFDKQPDLFFDALREARRRGLDFELALLGENFQKVPQPFLKAREEFGDRIKQYGWASSREDYIRWLREGDIVISCAIQENFGISVMEALRWGCRPLLPRRLSYPELIPEGFHDEVFYRHDEELAERLCSLLLQYRKDPEAFPLSGLADHAAGFAWDSIIPRYDSFFSSLLKAGRERISAAI